MIVAVHRGSPGVSPVASAPAMIATACSMEWLCGMSAIMKLSSEGRAAITQLTVRAENPVHGSDQQSCSSGCPAVMITDHVPALRLPSDHAGGLLVAAVPASGDVEDRRDLDLAPPARGPAATSAAPPELELGGPGSARDSAQSDTQSAPPGGSGSWSPRTRSCAGTATSSAAAGRRSPAAARPAGRPLAGTSGPWSSGWPARTPNGATAGFTASWPASE